MKTNKLWIIGAVAALVIIFAAECRNKSIIESQSGRDTNPRPIKPIRKSKLYDQFEFMARNNIKAILRGAVVFENSCDTSAIIYDSNGQISYLKLKGMEDFIDLKFDLNHSQIKR